MGAIVRRNSKVLLIAAAVLAANVTTLAAQPSSTVLPSLETGDSVSEDLALDGVDVGSILDAVKVRELFKPWFDAKRRLKEEHGLSIQFNYQTLYQRLSDSLGETEAAAGRAQIQGA